VKSPAELIELYRSEGRKITPQRTLLFGLMHGNTTHPTADALYEAASLAMPGISLRTVYQTLGELAEMGEIRLINCDGGATRFDPNVADHHHVVCSQCGAIGDVDVRDAASLRPVGARGFAVDEVGVVFHGTCATCRGARKGSPALQANR
jgi:Fe2+ or Zn2+ uptake regulation protein